MTVLGQLSLRINAQTFQVLTLVFQIAHVKLMQIVAAPELSNYH